MSEPSRDNAAESALVEFVISHSVGLHARPSLKFSTLARHYPCAIEFEVDGSGQWFNAKSIVKVLAARARKGSMLRIAASGPQALEAVEALKVLVEDGFGEAELPESQA